MTPTVASPASTTPLALDQCRGSQGEERDNQHGEISHHAVKRNRNPRKTAHRLVCTVSHPPDAPHLIAPPKPSACSHR